MICIHIRNAAYNLVNINCAEKNSFSLVSWSSSLVIFVTMLVTILLQEAQTKVNSPPSPGVDKTWA